MQSQSSHIRKRKQHKNDLKFYKRPGVQWQLLIGDEDAGFLAFVPIFSLYKLLLLVQWSLMPLCYILLFILQHNLKLCFKSKRDIVLYCWFSCQVQVTIPYYFLSGYFFVIVRYFKAIKFRSQMSGKYLISHEKEFWLRS